MQAKKPGGPKPPTEDELKVFRNLLAAIPRDWIGQLDGTDIHLTTRRFVDADPGDPLTYGVIYADDDEGRKVAQFVTQAPGIVERILESLDQMRELFTFLDVDAADAAMQAYKAAQKGTNVA